MKNIVAQSIPLELKCAFFVYQKPKVKTSLMFNVSIVAVSDFSLNPNPIAKTKSNVKPPQTSVTHCLSNFSVIISVNIARKIITAKICANNIINYILSSSLL